VVQYLDSSSIAWVHYDAAVRVLYVCFRESNEVYLYLDVKQQTYEQLIAAESRGAFLNREIKEHHDFKKLGVLDFIPTQPASE
jgi:hypothetical protein